MAHDSADGRLICKGKRGLYHAAAVLASNYTVVLAALAPSARTCRARRRRALPAIMPLLHSTMANLGHTGLPDALTGPLVRGDVGTVMRHLAALDRVTPEIAQVYRALGVSGPAVGGSTRRNSQETLRKLDDALHGVVLDATACSVLLPCTKTRR